MLLNTSNFLINGSEHKALNSTCTTVKGLAKIIEVGNHLSFSVRVLIYKYKIVELIYL